MTADIVVMIIAGLLVLVQLMWRTHVPLVIYATCAGYVLATTWASELVMQLGKVSQFFITDTGYSIVSLSLFLLPPFITTYQFRGTMSHRLLQQFVPAIFWVLFTFAFALKLLPLEVRQALIDASHITVQVNSFASWTVLLALGVATIELMSQHDLLKPKSRRKRRGRED